MNKVILSGRLTKDCEIRRSASNVAVVKFTLAVDEYNQKTKEREAQFIDCVIFDKRGEIFDKYNKQGDAVIVIGKLRKSTFDTKDGRKASKIEVIVEDFEFGEKKKGTSVKQENPVDAIVEPPAQAPVQEVPLDDLTDDDLPF